MIKVDDRKVVIFVILFIILLTFMSQVSAINSLTVLGEHLFGVGGCIAHLMFANLGYKLFFRRRVPWYSGKEQG